jgi:dethiobiotin synthetase
MMPHASRLTPNGFFITGTDTGVGKTLIACAVLHAFAARGLHVIGMKPVAAGAQRVNGVWHNEDVEQLIAAGNVSAPRDVINPYCFEPPIAPHIAADMQNNPIIIKHLKNSFEQLSALADIVVVEGAGGFCVPLNDRETSADLARALALPVVLVVGMRLGCINHALLSAEAIRARGLALAGWIANHIDPAMLHADANVAALQARLAAPLIARIAFSEHPHAGTIASQLNLGALP